MLHAVSAHVKNQMADILRLAGDIIFNTTKDDKPWIENLDREEPGISLASKMQYLVMDLESGKRLNGYRLLMTDVELRTVASALALVEWMYPEITQRQDLVEWMYQQKYAH
jgi:hypothetical protein